MNFYTSVTNIYTFFSTVQVLSPSGTVYAMGKTPRESLTAADGTAINLATPFDLIFISQETAYPPANDSIHKITHSAESVQE